MSTEQIVPPLYEAEKVSPETVLVTGATGFVAGSLVHRLLVAGHTVHATVRDVSKAEELKALPGAADRLKLFSADLTKPGSFDEAIQGCTYVFHTASPFLLNGGHGAVAQKRLVEPAVKGTENVLDSVNRCPTVKRVVLTSSVAAVSHSGFDKPPGTAFTEEDWNNKSTLNNLPYFYSKAQAEKKAWEICKAQDRWTMVTINPSLVLGPPMTSRADGASISIIKDVFKGIYGAVPPMGLGMVDVRDVAAAHSLAAFHPNAQGRYILSNESMWIKRLVEIIAQLYPKTVKKPASLPKFLKPLLWLVAPLAGLTRDQVSASLGTTIEYSNDKVKKELGLVFLPVEQSLKDMCDTMAKFKLLTIKD